MTDTARSLDEIMRAFQETEGPISLSPQEQETLKAARTENSNPFVYNRASKRRFEETNKKGRLKKGKRIRG